MAPQSPRWRGRVLSVGETHFRLKLHPLRGTPGEPYDAELPNSSMPRYVRYRRRDEVLVEPDGNGGFRLKWLPWYRSPRQLIYALGEFLGALNP